MPNEALPENMRVSTVLDRPEFRDPVADRQTGECPGVEGLDFLLIPATLDFATASAQAARAFYGEFDQPDPEARLALIRLYLMSGFGAEARVLIENSPDPVASRDLLLGIADVLEGRASNSRHRLSQALACGGPAATFALLAGAEGPPLPAAQIALTFSQFPATLRAIVGPDLVQRLADAGAIDAARIAADSLRRSPWYSASQMPWIDAELDRARGNETIAAERLAHFASADARSLQTRLDIALQTGQAIADTDLIQAEALASAERNSEAGTALMASLIRLRARDGAFDSAFAALDRLGQWLATTPSNQARLAELRNTVWHQLSHYGDDLAVAAALLNRQDWRDDGLAEPVRFSLADRLLDLGLTTPVSSLLQENETPEGLHLRARAALARGSADAALALLSALDDAPASALRAMALAQLGENGQAADAFQTLGEGAAARHAAILARDWQRLRQIAAPSPDPDEVILGTLLTTQPGHSRMAQDGGLTIPEPRSPETIDIQDQPAPQQAAPHDAITPDMHPPASAPAASNRHEPRTAPLDAHAVAVTDGLPTLAAQVPAGAPSPHAGEGQAATDGTAAAPDGLAARAPLDNPTPFDRLGVVTRGSLLLSESEHLRNALRAVVETPFQ